jgi:hypothetical protein
VANHGITEDAVRAMYATAMHSMGTLNRDAARFMHKHKSQGATDVTGFGLVGHASNLCENMEEFKNIQFVMHTLYAIKGTIDMDAKCSEMFKLKQGQSAETSGGLLCVLPSREAGGSSLLCGCGCGCVCEYCVSQCEPPHAWDSVCMHIYVRCMRIHVTTFNS